MELTDFEVIPTDLPEADITDAAGFDALLKQIKPDVVIHCAAMTAVDKCETEIDFAYKLNAFGTANVAAACHRNGIHLTCEGEASWADFAAEIFRLKGIDQKIVPCTTAEFPRPAPRPKNSRLDKMMLRLNGLPPMMHWKDALKEFMQSEFGR